MYARYVVANIFDIFLLTQVKGFYFFFKGGLCGLPCQFEPRRKVDEDRKRMRRERTRGRRSISILFPFWRMFFRVRKERESRSCASKDALFQNEGAPTVRHCSLPKRPRGQRWTNSRCDLLSFSAILLCQKNGGKHPDKYKVTVYVDY